MWIIPPSLACARELADSTSDCEWRSQLLERSVTWNTKLRLSRSWSRAWKADRLTRHLYGLICEPSTADRFVESWISSLAESPARNSRSLARAGEPKVNGISGPIQPELFESVNQNGSGLRMCRGWSATSTTKSCPSCQRWATWLRRYSLRLRTSVRHTAASASSSWPTASVTTTGGPTGLSGGSGNRRKFDEIMAHWPTPQTMQAPNANANQKYLPPSLEAAAIAMWPTATAEDAESSQARREKDVTLTEAAKTWPTPAAADSERQSETYKRGNPTLQGQALWSTPRQTDAMNGSGEHGEGGLDLRTQTEMWGTPRGEEAANWLTPSANEDAAGGPEGKMQFMLKQQAEQWQTPSDPKFKMRRQANQTERTEALLPAQAEQWQTPASDSFRSRGGERKDEMGLDQQSRSFPPAQPITTDGDESSPSDPNSRQRRKLNPLFVAWLMNWPEDWLSLGPNNCGSQAMESYLYRLRSHLSFLLGGSAGT